MRLKLDTPCYVLNSGLAIWYVIDNVGYCTGLQWEQVTICPRCFSWPFTLMPPPPLLPAGVLQCQPLCSYTANSPWGQRSRWLGMEGSQDLGQHASWRSWPMALTLPAQTFFYTWQGKLPRVRSRQEQGCKERASPWDRNRGRSETPWRSLSALWFDIGIKLKAIHLTRRHSHLPPDLSLGNLPVSQENKP